MYTVVALAIKCLVCEVIYLLCSVLLLIESTDESTWFNQLRSNVYNISQLYCVCSCRDLVEKANCWLRQNPQYFVKSCETMRWWSTLPIQVGDTEQVILQQSSSSSPSSCLEEDAIYLTGLRYTDNKLTYTT